MELILKKIFKFLIQLYIQKGEKLKYIAVDKNGFIYGGNEFNCCTWMDKMGHDGMPVTSRHVTNIEIIALL